MSNASVSAPTAHTAVYDREATLDRLLHAAARRTPGAIALSCDGRDFTYAELDAASSRLARRYQTLGVRPGARVATLTRRRPEAVIAWLAALKAGAAVVSIDPAYPAKAMRYMIEDSAAALVIGDPDLAPAPETAEESPIAIRALDAELAAAAGLSDAPLALPIKPTDLAYVIYTSGSTGRPKGVALTHRGLNHLSHDQDYVELAAGRPTLMIANFSFDAVLWEVYAALMHGNRLELVSDARMSFDAIAKGLERAPGAAAQLPTALFNALVDFDPSLMRGFGVAFVGGDVMSPDHVRRAQKAAPDLKIYNAYGPAENTVYLTMWPVPAGGWRDGPAPIGAPTRHTSAYILDEDGQPVADGEIGELWCGGEGVAAGYLGRPDLTEERFKPDPFAAEGGVMYRTGDLARRREDGYLDFLGRRDRQVKIEGKRVELDQVEFLLREDPRLDDAIVVAVERPSRGKTIVAFVKPAAGEMETGDALAAAVIKDLRARAEAHFAPHETRIVEDYPRTPNRKIDRKALTRGLEAEIAAAAAGAEGEAIFGAEGGTETRIAAHLRALAGPLALGRTDNFLESGVTSLIMMRLHAKLQAEGASALAIADLFANPTLAGLAARLEALAAGEAGETSASARGRERGARQSGAFGRLSKKKR